MYKRILVPLMVLVSMLAAACGGPAASPTAAPKAGSTPAAADKSSAAAKKYTIGVALADQTNPFYVAMGQGVTDQAKELGHEVVLVVAAGDQSKQVSQVQDLITRKVDVILISPITAEGAVPAYEAAKQAGIPIVSIARNIGKPDVEKWFVGADWTKYGAQVAEYLAKKLNGKGKVAMSKGVAGSSVSVEMEKGFKDVMKKYPDIKIVAEQNSSLDKENGLKLAETFMSANPDLDAIYNMNDELALGAVQAADAAGKAGKVLITGFNGQPPAVDAVKAGKMAYTVALKSYTWGKLGVRTAIDILGGKQVPALVEIESMPVTAENAKDITPAQLQ